MTKEIERKFLLTSELSLTDLYNKVLLQKTKLNIKDYYFNPTARLRLVNDGDPTITIKSLEYFCRDEYEFKISNFKEESITNWMIKQRYLIPWDKYTFEVNVYQNLFLMDIFKGDNLTPLILIEVELDDINETFIHPSFLGQEVTFDPTFYNFNLWTVLQDKIQGKNLSTVKCNDTF